ncbi:hypothetical protein AX767_20465 [Variovorax sp. PAMC 28711]|nr:hypothetical protein AX767_20465 [Variovorax sp. PAMC 28711]
MAVVIPAPQLAQRSNPVSKVGLLTTRAGVTAGERSWRLRATSMNTGLAMREGMLTTTHSSCGLSSLVRMFFLLKIRSPTYAVSQISW